MPDDRTILVETFRDPAGELGLAVLSPFGGRIHQALKLALLGRIRRRLGIQASCLHGDEGLLIRLPQIEEPPLTLLDGLTADEAEELIRLELPETALYGLRFRQNAARALLMPRPDPSKRTPLWLQRLRAKDLLQVVGKFPDFPIVVETFRECLDHDLELPRLRALLDDIGKGTIQVVTRQAEIASPFASELIFQFTPLYLYQWDEPRRGDLRSAEPAVDEGLLDSLLQSPDGGRLLDPQAVGRVESRLRRRGHAPRTAEEMAETLRTLGDLAASDLFGAMDHFLKELEAQGRAIIIRLPGTAEPLRWISAEAEEEALYRRAFDPAGEPDLDALDAVVRRYLYTHALIGLGELTARYPIAPELASELLERWVEAGEVIRLAPAGEAPAARWAERENLAEVHRLSVAIRRRETVAVAPEIFADFLVRRQHLHAATRLDGTAGLEQALELLQGFAAAPAFWESELLFRRVRGYRSGWLDDLLAAGSWLWRAAADGRNEPLVALVPRGFTGSWPDDPERPEGTEAERKVLDILTVRGASFATDLARMSGLEPSRLRHALRELMLRGCVTNDRFDPLRPGAFEMLDALAEASETRTGRSRRARPRRVNPSHPEGRWSVLEPSDEDGEARRLDWIDVLLERYGVLSREVMALDPWAPPWAELAPLLARAELRGELRRGYFVEGLSGVQYATGDAAEGLAALAGTTAPASGDVLLAAGDPANLYGTGAPLDIPLLEGGTARLNRIPGNYLVLKYGRPVLIIEAHGKRLTGLASASGPEIREALRHVVELARPQRQVLKVETYNGEPALASVVADRLTELGFVRDYPGMTYYAAWASHDKGPLQPPDRTACLPPMEAPLDMASRHHWVRSSSHQRTHRTLPDSRKQLAAATLGSSDHEYPPIPSAGSSGSYAPLDPIWIGGSAVIPPFHPSIRLA